MCPLIYLPASEASITAIPPISSGSPMLNRGFVSVKDSLFGFDNRYETMMYVPFSKNDDTKFELKAGFLNQNGIDIPVFEALVKKRVILHDQSLNLILKENQVQSVDGVNGASLKIGSMDEVNTNGNWPKNYSKDK